MDKLLTPSLVYSEIGLKTVWFLFVRWRRIFGTLGVYLCLNYFKMGNKTKKNEFWINNYIFATNSNQIMESVRFRDEYCRSLYYQELFLKLNLT